MITIIQERGTKIIFRSHFKIRRIIYKQTDWCRWNLNLTIRSRDMDFQSSIKGYLKQFIPLKSPGYLYFFILFLDFSKFKGNQPINIKNWVIFDRKSQQQKNNKAICKIQTVCMHEFFIISNKCTVIECLITILWLA